MKVKLEIVEGHINQKTDQPQDMTAIMSRMGFELMSHKPDVYPEIKVAVIPDDWTASRWSDPSENLSLPFN